MQDNTLAPSWTRQDAIDNEVGLLANLLFDPAQLREVSPDIVTAQDFFRVEHSDIFRSIDSIVEEAARPEVMAITNWLKQSGGYPLDESDDRWVLVHTALDAVLAACFTGTNATYYAGLVAEMGRRRRRYLQIAELHRAVSAGNLPADDIDQQVKTLADTGELGSAPAGTTLRDAMHDWIDTLEQAQLVHFPSGIQILDDSIDGVAAGEMCVIGARPAHCKSAMGLQWCHHVAKLGHSCLVLSQEMAAIQLGRRSLMRASPLGEEAWDQHAVPSLRQHANAFIAERAVIHIFEYPSTIERAEKLIRWYAKQQQVRLVVVDYLQILRASGSRTRYEDVTEISFRLKRSAAENNVALLALCQVSRLVEERTDFRPRLSDLKESGQVEQDADLVLFPQHLSRFSSKHEPWKFRIYVAKRRNGKIREPVVDTCWNANSQTIGV